MAAQFFRPRVRRPVTASRRLPLVLCSQVAWDTVWQRPQEQAMGISRFRPVLFLGPVQLHELTGRLAGRWEPVRILNGGRLIVVSPVLFSGEYRASTIRQVNRQVLRMIAARYPAFHRGIFLSNSPFYGWLADAFKAKATGYDLIDDFCAFGWAPQEGPVMEDRLIERCQFGLAGTGYLREKYASRFPGLEFFPSGVQFERMTAPQPEPEELKDLPRPRALYVGTLNDRLDGELFLTVAKSLKGGTLVVVGPKHETFKAPELPANVTFLGLMPHERLPEFYQHCGLGIMPFADSPAARAINPVKTLEYLACGLPVLSTPVPDVIKYYPDVVRVEAPAGWAEATSELLAGDSPELRQTRSDFARGRSWNRLVQSLEQRLREFDP
jgi:UDP-galactopyranose mutase